MIVLGLLLGMVGMDVNSGVARYPVQHHGALRRDQLRRRRDGPVRLLRDPGQPRAHRETRGVHGQSVGAVADQAGVQGGCAARCCAARSLGSVLGLLPGRRRGAGLVRRVYRREEARAEPAAFGRGAIAGVAGPESANNAGAQTSFIPMLTLGIPPNAVMALMIGAMTIHNIQPGPQVMTSNPDSSGAWSPRCGSAT